MNQMLDNLREFFVTELPGLVVPIAVLVVGWIFALLLSALTRRTLRRTSVDERIARLIVGEERAASIRSDQVAGKLVYYVVLLLTLLAFLQAARLTAATEPINALLGSVFEFIPNLVGAAAIGLVAWVVAALTRSALRHSLERWDIDRRVSGAAKGPEAPATEQEGGEGATEPQRRLSPAISEAAYWLVLLLFAPAILGALRLRGLLGPVEQMFERALGFVPNIASALLIAGVGWFVAHVARRLVATTLAGIGTDRLSDRVGLARVLGDLTLSSLIGFVTYIFILIPVAIGALNALQLEAITRPASEMLGAFFDAVPAIVGAALLVAIAYVVARLLYGVVSRLLAGLGFDKVLENVGIASDRIGERTPSELVGGVVMVAVFLFAGIEGAGLLGFETVASLGRDFTLLAGHVLFGLVIFGVGLFLANLAAKAVAESGITQARVLSGVTRVAVLVLAGAMALRQMGVANEIAELAFGLVLGAVAVAAALAFGLGGREAASKALDDLRGRFEKRAAHEESSERAAS